MATRYRTISGDTWDLISYRVYGDCKYTDTLINNNTAYADVVVFRAGTILNVPDIELETPSALPPWKR